MENLSLQEKPREAESAVVLRKQMKVRETKKNEMTEEDNVSEMKWQDIERYGGVKEVRCAAVLETV